MSSGRASYKFDSLPRVFVVDPHAESAHRIEQLLQNWGVVTFRAHTADEAVELGAARSYDLILMTMTRHAIDSVGMLRRLRETGPNRLTPVVGAVRDSLWGESSEMLEAGANDVIPSPPTIRMLASVFWYWLPIGGKRWGR